MQDAAKERTTFCGCRGTNVSNSSSESVSLDPNINFVSITQRNVQNIPQETREPKQRRRRPRLKQLQHRVDAQEAQRTIDAAPRDCTGLLVLPSVIRNVTKGGNAGQCSDSGHDATPHYNHLSHPLTRCWRAYRPHRRARTVHQLPAVPLLRHIHTGNKTTKRAKKDSKKKN